MRILIVDDEPGIREVCGRALRAAGHEVSGSASGEEALQRLGEPWDLIVTDLTMPGVIDGNELVRRVHAAGGTRIALMTGNPTLSSTIAAFKDGACDYLLKPFPLSSLVDLARPREIVAAPQPRAIEPRRLVVATVLFADVRGFTTFAEAASPEDVAARLDEVLACFIKAVHAEGGTINKLTGDGAMAVFGAPLPHAEPAAAAVRAALSAREAVARLSRLRFGFGLNTGLVAAGCLGSGGSSEFGVIGAVVNVAARLQEAAGPGQILAGEETLAHLTGRFQFGEERMLTLKGLSAPVRAYEVLS